MDPDEDELSSAQGHALRSIRALTAPALAPWTPDSNGQALERADRVVGNVARYDWAMADTERLEHSAVKASAFRDKGKHAETLGLMLRRELEAILAAGLERRVGQRLSQHDRDVFLQLAARVAIDGRWTYVPGWQVCERCDVVFPAHQRNARRCADCRRRKLPTVYPHDQNGWHIGTLGDSADHTLRYIAQCECGNTFIDQDVLQRLCPNCRHGAARVKRLRDRRTVTHQQTRSATRATVD